MLTLKVHVETYIKT